MEDPPSPRYIVSRLLKIPMDTKIMPGYTQQPVLLLGAFMDPKYGRHLLQSSEYEIVIWHSAGTPFKKIAHFPCPFLMDLNAQ